MLVTMKKLLIITCVAFLLSSCASLKKEAGYSKDTQMNEDWRTRKL